MAKIAFKHPKGDTIYWAKVGFDWGAFWALPVLGGLPFFLRRMNILGVYCLAFSLIVAVTSGLERLVQKNSFYMLPMFVFGLGISIYFGIRGGKLTARHYLEEGYVFHTKDKALLDRAKKKWNLEV